MLADIRKIMIEKRIKENEFIRRQKEELEKMQSFVSQYDGMTEEEIEMKVEGLYKEQQAITMKQRKLFTKLFRPNKKTELQKIMNETSKMISDMRTLTRYRDAISDIKSRIDIEIQKINSRAGYENSISEFGLDYAQAIELLESNGMPIILDESDKIKINNVGQLNDLKDFVLVHKTRYLPTNGRIRTSKEAGKTDTQVILDKIGSLEYSTARNTIHFSVNGEVSSHSYGSWDDCKYAILIPFNKVPASQLRSGAAMDTFIEGGLNLPSDAILLCPKEEIEEAKKASSNLNVVGYDGPNVMGYADVMVGMLGYKVEDVGMWAWWNQKDTDKYYGILKQEYPQLSIAAHTATYEHCAEEALTKISLFESMIDKIINENITLTQEEILALMKNSRISVFGSSYDDSEKGVLQAEIINELQSFLKKYGLSIPQNIVDRVLEIVTSEGYPITEDESNQYKNSLNIKNDFYYLPLYEYVNFLIKGSILSQVVEMQNNNQFHSGGTSR